MANSSAAFHSASSTCLLRMYWALFSLFQSYSICLSINLYLSACFSLNFWSSLSLLSFSSCSFCFANSAIFHSSSSSFYHWSSCNHFYSSLALPWSSINFQCASSFINSFYLSFSKFSNTYHLINSPSIISSCIFLT